MGGFIIFGLVFIICLILYFVPTIVALQRDHRNAVAIIVLNLFLGWSLIGWVGALCWALYRSESVTGPYRPSSADRAAAGRPVAPLALPTSRDLTPEQESALAAQVAREDRERFKSQG